MEAMPLYQNEFYHDGRGPELHRVIWVQEGKVLKGFEYFNPDDEYKEENIKCLILDGVEVILSAGEEVHGNILSNRKSKSAIFKVFDSAWFKQFNPRHLDGCSHFQIMFYDEIYDIICRGVKFGRGRII